MSSRLYLKKLAKKLEMGLFLDYRNAVIEFYKAYSQFSNAFKLVKLAIFGPKSNIQILEEVCKAILVMLRKRKFHF